MKHSGNKMGAGRRRRWLARINLVGKLAQFARCGEAYNIPISWGFAPSRFFMAFVPTSLPTSSDF
jgi:hypothetical protein